MKKLLTTLTLTTLVTLNVSASQNPFDLNENLKKIDQDQNTLLDELKKLAQQREAAEDESIDSEGDDEEIDAVVSDETNVKEQVQEKEQTSTMPKAPQSEKPSPEAGSAEESGVKGPDRIQEIRKRMMAQEALRAKETAKKEEAVAKPKGEEAPMKAEALKAKQQAEAAAKKAADAKAAEEQAKRERLAKEKAAQEAAKRAQEKREVEAYEAARRAKKEAEAKAAAIEAAKEATNKATQALPEVSKSKEEVVEPTETSGIDFNITQEQIEAKKRAEEELRKAIMEVEQEN